MMAAVEAERLWNSAFPDKERPQLYISNQQDEDGFQPINDPQAFISDINSLNNLQLYAASVNNQVALKQAQDEYLDITREIATIKGKEVTKNPQKLQDPELFEERKESVLYGYKYEAPKPVLLQNGQPGLRVADEVSEREKFDVRYLPEPFQQGGFVPTEKQYKAMLAKSTHSSNIDGWKAVERNGKRLVPVQQKQVDEYSINYIRRKINEDGELIRPGSADSDDSLATPTKVVNKRLTRTRFGGKKVPPTREVSETPSAASTPGRKRRGTPAFDDREHTPSLKRQRLNGVERPRHHNQYTKGKEVGAGGGGGRDPSMPFPIWSQLSTKEKRERKWNDEELVDSIKQDHTWLHDDPNKSADWKYKIINGINPVRSYSMLMKWAYWKVENKDKRPRGKKESAGKEKSATPRGSRAPARRKLQNMLRDTASASPYPEPSIDGENFTSSEPGSRPARRGRSSLGNRAIVNYEETEDELHPDTETEVDDRTEENDIGQPLGRDANTTPPGLTISLKEEDTGSEITVNGEQDQNEGMNGMRSATTTPPLQKTSPATMTPARRSMRNSRRGSS